MAAAVGRGGGAVPLVSLVRAVTNITDQTSPSSSAVGRCDGRPQPPTAASSAAQPPVPCCRARAAAVTAPRQVSEWQPEAHLQCQRRLGLGLGVRLVTPVESDSMIVMPLAAAGGSRPDSDSESESLQPYYLNGLSHMMPGSAGARPPAAIFRGFDSMPVQPQ